MQLSYILVALHCWDPQANLFPKIYFFVGNGSSDNVFNHFLWLVMIRPKVITLNGTQIMSNEL